MCIPLDSNLASLLCCSIIDYLLNVAHIFRLIVLGHISGNMSCREVRNLALLYVKDFNFEVVSSCCLFRNHSDQYTLWLVFRVIWSFAIFFYLFKDMYIIHRNEG